MQEIDREHTDALGRISRIRAFSVKELLAIANQYTNNVRGAAVSFIRCALVCCWQPVAVALLPLHRRDPMAPLEECAARGTSA